MLYSSHKFGKGGRRKFILARAVNNEFFAIKVPLLRELILGQEDLQVPRQQIARLVAKTIRLFWTEYCREKRLGNAVDTNLTTLYPNINDSKAFLRGFGLKDLEDLEERKCVPFFALKLRTKDPTTLKAAPNLRTKQRSLPNNAIFVLKLLLPAMKELVKAHAQGISHHNLKPDNMVLVENEQGEMEAHVLDYGLAVDKERSFLMDFKKHKDIARVPMSGTRTYFAPKNYYDSA